MIDGRTMFTGHVALHLGAARARRVPSCSVYAPGQPSDAARERARLARADPLTQRWRSCSVLLASAECTAAELAACPERKPAEPLGVAARRAGVRAAAGARRPRAPVDAEVEGAVTDELLGRAAATVAGDVAGRHATRDAVARRGCAASRRCGPDRAGSPRLRRRSRESNDTVAARVDDDLARGERLVTGVVEPEPVGAHVTADHS